jgi:response regulator RpfG family c-di-GMP phosphodiesterase
MLAVDDEAENVDLLERVFRKTFEFSGCTDPLEAEEICMSREFDLLIVDQRMPELVGTELLRRVSGRQPKSCRVLLTGYSDLEAAISAINDGRVHRYVRKPFNEQELLGHVHKLTEHLMLDRRMQAYYQVLQDEVSRLRAQCEALRARVRHLDADPKGNDRGATS